MSETNQWNRVTFHYCIESQSSLLLHLHTQSEASKFLKSKPINLVHHSVWLLLMFLSPRKNNIANSPFRKKSIAAVDFEMKSNLMVEASDQVPYNVQRLMQHETVYEFFLCQFFIFPFRCAYRSGFMYLICKRHSISVCLPSGPDFLLETRMYLEETPTGAVN
jgi:hypothetical protein